MPGESQLPATFQLIYSSAATTYTPQDHGELKQDYVHLEGQKGGLTDSQVTVSDLPLRSQGRNVDSLSTITTDLACIARFYLLHHHDCKVLGRLFVTALW